jgi:acetyl-CoA carboxylase biotin carboxylase subunit
MPLLKRVLIANRGEIAVRVIDACKALGIETVLAVSKADRETLGAQRADRTVCIGPAAAAASYLNPALVCQAALSTGCDGLHPGYGFLSERFELAKMCEDNQLKFIGPSAESIRRVGDKLEAKPRCRGSRCADRAGFEPGGDRRTKPKAGGSRGSATRC